MNKSKPIAVIYNRSYIYTSNMSIEIYRWDRHGMVQMQSFFADSAVKMKDAITQRLEPIR